LYRVNFISFGNKHSKKEGSLLKDIRRNKPLLAKFLRFGLVGTLNTIVDIAALNILLWIFPTHDTWQILAFNSLACIVAACNSFFWNKYWTFKYRGPITTQLVLRFAAVSFASMLGNNILLWIFIQLLPFTLSGAGVGATLLKVAVGASMMTLSFVGQLTLVFVANIWESKKQTVSLPQPPSSYFPISISIVLPAYNEEAVIATTVVRVFQALSRMGADFEILVVNDGSKDRTGAIVAAIAAQERRVRLVTHKVNQGAGAALVSGFIRATKAYTFYMDADGQFDINDLVRMLPYLSEYDGVFGYRLYRQDPWIRKLNGWCWNQIVRFIFNIRIKDIDCAFKIFRTDYFRQVVLEARGALLLTEVVYKFARAGYNYTEVPVRHLPREGGNPTGAKPTVILRAFKELFYYASKWHEEEQQSLYGKTNYDRLALQKTNVNTRW
jgi:putative flippase GtrA